MSKYGNRKVIVDGIVFDSAREARRWRELRFLEDVGEITDLRRQVPFTLVPAQRVGKNVVERAVTYKADFVYNEAGETVVEDTKGVRTKDYIIKRKLMLWLHGIRVREI